MHERHDPWTHLRDVFERAMGNLERKEGIQARTHLRAAEHTSETIGRKAEGDERHRAGVIFTAVRKAEHLIDMNRALEVLREAHTIAFVGVPAPAGAASASSTTPADASAPVPSNSADASAPVPSGSADASASPPPPTTPTNL